jgi:hypothetical protein
LFALAVWITTNTMPDSKVVSVFALKMLAATLLVYHLFTLVLEVLVTAI